MPEYAMCLSCRQEIWLGDPLVRTPAGNYHFDCYYPKEKGMEQNGKVYCGYCHLEIGKQKHVRIPRPQIAGKAPRPDAYFHNREGYSNDCWARVRKEAEVRKETASRQMNFSFHGTPREMTNYEKWQAQQEAKSQLAKKGGGL